MTSAHRLAYRLNVGPTPVGLEVCHSCDTPLCVRPDHLFLGTSQENADDMVAKGRQSHHAPPQQVGESNHAAKLTRAQVVQIRDQFADGARQVDLARRFGTTKANVHCIVRGKSWAEA